MVYWCSRKKTDIVKLDEFLANECSDGTYDGGFFRGKTEYEIGVGLIRPSDYISTSSLENCVNSHSSECGMLPDGTITNFLYKNDYSWYSLNAFANDDESIWGFSAGIWDLETDASYATRPVINLNPNVLHAGGNGTLTNPYKIK